MSRFDCIWIYIYIFLSLYMYLCNECLSPHKLRVQVTTHAKVYSIQLYVIKILISRLWFSPGIPVTATNKTNVTTYYITEMVLKVALNPYYIFLP
jgi:hypothetical protein